MVLLLVNSWLSLKGFRRSEQATQAGSAQTFNSKTNQPKLGQQGEKVAMLSLLSLKGHSTREAQFQN